MLGYGRIEVKGYIGANGLTVRPARFISISSCDQENTIAAKIDGMAA